MNLLPYAFGDDEIASSEELQVMRHNGFAEVQGSSDIRDAFFTVAEQP